MVSDTTLMSMPTNGLAASWNHLSSVVCCSLLSVLGENSASALLIASARSTGGGLASAVVPLPAVPVPVPPSGFFLPQPADHRAAATVATPRTDNHEARCQF